MDRSRHSRKLPVLSGLILALSYFPFPLLVPGLVAFVPLLFWLDATGHRPFRERLRGAFGFGITLYLVILYWMYALLETSWLGVVLYLFLSVVFAAIASASVLLAGWLRARTRWSFALLLPASWIPLEWAQTFGDTRMTAEHLGHTLAGYPFLIQFADLVGMYGVGAFLLVVNALLYEAVRGRRRAAAVLTVVILSVLGYDAWCWTHPPEASGRLRVALVQPNIPLEQKQSFGFEREQWQVLSRLTLEAAGMSPDLIVWPETAAPRRMFHWVDHPRTYALPWVQLLARQTGTTILAGAEYQVQNTEEDIRLYNAAFVVHPDGTLDPTWTAKVYLVPFVEEIPYAPILGPVLGGLEGELRWLSGGFTRGERATVIPIDGARVGILICYEELYPDLARDLRNAGADFQAILTNDAWFGRTYFQDYQANTVRMRAIENRSSFVRVANTGISGFVDPRGRYHGWTALFTEEVAVEDVALTTGRTVYDRIGDLVAWLAVLGLGAASLVAIRAGRVTERTTDGDEPERPDVGDVSRDGSDGDRPGAGPRRDD